LKHLTTTLEILGNVFFMRNELEEAKQCLERACPLMELLPSSVMESLDDITIGTMNGEFNFIRDNEIDETLREQIILNEIEDDGSRNYADDCFGLLRNVYRKLYAAYQANKKAGEEDNLVPETDDNDHSQDMQDDGLPNEKRRRNPSSHSSSFHSSDVYDDGEDTDEEYEEPHFTSSYDDFSPFEDEIFSTARAAKARQPHHRLSVTKDFIEESDGRELVFDDGSLVDVESKIEDLRSPFQHLRSELQMIQNHNPSSPSASSGGNRLSSSRPSFSLGDDEADDLSYEEEKQKKAVPVSFSKKVADVTFKEPPSHGTQQKGMKKSTQPETNDGKPTSSGDGKSTRVSSSMSSSRIPRIGRIVRKPLNNPTVIPSKDTTSSVSAFAPSTLLETLKQQFGTNFRNLFFSSSFSSAPSDVEELYDGESDFLSLSPSTALDSTYTAKEREALLALGGSATSIIASDLEVMLRRFVREDEEGRKELYRVARKYYDQLYINYPTVSHLAVFFSVLALSGFSF
jgi:hypothetical protein